MRGVLYAGQPGTADAAAVVDTVADGQAADAEVEIKSASVSNGTGGSVTLTVKVSKDGGAERLVYSALAVAAGATTPLSALIGLVLGPNDSIHLLASAAASLDVVISGLEVRRVSA